jgi:hypothetical protein
VAESAQANTLRPGGMELLHRRLRRRNALSRHIGVAGAVVFGAAIGTLSALTGWVWLDIAFTVGLAVSWMVERAVATAIVRRRGGNHKTP